MEVEDSNDILFKDWTPESSLKILPQIRKCITESQSEREVLRALEIAFDFCLKYLTVAEVEDELFQNACLTSKRIVEERLKNIEKNPTSCVEGLNVSLQIISFFEKVFLGLSAKHIVEVKNFLTVTSEIVFCCLSHCKISEKVYGSLLGSLAEHLSKFFKRCCDLLEHLLNFLTKDTKCVIEDESEILLLDKVLTVLSKSGIALISLEIKTMAKVWKAFAFIIENHVCMRENYNIEKTIEGLCCNITNSMELILCEDGQQLEKVIKLNCFLLKLIIKFCTVFNGVLKNCHNSLLNLSLSLCRWDVFGKTQQIIKMSKSQELLNQLTIGTEPLLSILMKDVAFVKEFHKMYKNCKNVELPVLCCLILKQLINLDSVTRSLWFNENENILIWIFFSASSSEFISTNISLPNIVINGKQTKYTDLYEYVLVSTSAFLMTIKTDEYYLVERMLIMNVLQMNPIRALLATDIWCLLARFAPTELCFSQILLLSETLQEILETPRIEKWYLMSLIRRLFPLLSESHKEMFLKSFQSSFYSILWEGCWFDGLTPAESSRIREGVLNRIDHVLEDNEGMSMSCRNEIRVLKLWKFNCEILVSSVENERFMKILCGLTSSVISDLPSEGLFLVLTQIKKLLTIGQSTCIQLYFTQLLKSLSTVFIPVGNFQKKIITTIAEIFRILLSSKQIIAKQKAFETFYTFSHVTSHGEVISLTVQDASQLKTEITNYFKKVSPIQTDFSLGDYFRKLYDLKFEHVCVDLGIDRGKINYSSVELKRIAMKWKENGKEIIECFQFFSELEKREIKNVCQSILYLPDI